MFSFVIILTCFIRFLNNSTEESFKRNGGRKFRCVFIPFTSFFSSQDRPGLHDLKYVHTYFVFCLKKQVSNFPTHDETGLGAIFHQALVTSIENSNKKWKNCRFTYNERYLIGKYTAIHGPIAAVKQLKKSHPHLEFGESTARSLRERYHNKWMSSDHSAVIQKKQVRSPLMLGAIDQKVQNFLIILREELRRQSLQIMQHKHWLTEV